MEIISYINAHSSFSWQNGLYIVVKIEDDMYKLCKLNNNFEPELFDDGRYMISCTTKSSPYVHKTNLIYANKNFIRKTKLEKLSK